MFVVACPCGFGLAAPTALLVGSGLAAQFGILVRGGGEAFQEAAQLDLIVFDKTGTLTEGGEPVVTDFELSASQNEDERKILYIIDQLESASSHPLATALRKFCTERLAAAASTSQVHLSSVDETSGRGLKGHFEDFTAIIGNEAWMSENGSMISPAQDVKLEEWKMGGKSVVLFAMQCKRKIGDEATSADSGTFATVGIFAIADRLRPESPGVVAALHRAGLATWMISGDNEKTAKAVALSVGIPDTNIIAGVLPHQKVWGPPDL